MLCYDIRELEREAIRVDGCLDPTDAVWLEGDVLPAEPVQATGRLSKAGTGRYYWSGHIDGTLHGECRRCLIDVSAHVAEDVHVLFAGSGDEIADDPDAYALPSHAAVLDLRPAVREQWLLGVPSFLLCREDCKGMCPRCGADRNAGLCKCPSETDSRWDALRAGRHAPHQP